MSIVKTISELEQIGEQAERIARMALQMYGES